MMKVEGCIVIRGEAISEDCDKKHEGQPGNRNCDPAVTPPPQTALPRSRQNSVCGNARQLLPPRAQLAHTWIEHAIEQIDGDIGGNHGGGHNEQDALDDSQITARNRDDQQTANAWP